MGGGERAGDGSQFTSKLEGMFKDVDLSCAWGCLRAGGEWGGRGKRGLAAHGRRAGLPCCFRLMGLRWMPCPCAAWWGAADVMAAFRQHAEQAQRSGPAGVDVHVSVLTSGFWPTYPVQEAQLPQVRRATAGIVGA